MRFCFEHTVPLARDKVFAFFEDPERLELLHAGWSKVRLLHCETQVRVGAEAWMEVSVAGLIPMVLGFRHILVEPPVRFGEQLIHGPFSRFIHIHEFASESGKTVVRDFLEICLPWHYGGHYVMERAVGPAIRQMFRNRANALRRLVDEGTVARCSSRRM